MFLRYLCQADCTPLRNNVWDILSNLAEDSNGSSARLFGFLHEIFGGYLSCYHSACKTTYSICLVFVGGSVGDISCVYLIKLNVILCIESKQSFDLRLIIDINLTL